MVTRLFVRLVLTGKLPTMTRSQAKNLIEKFGGIIGSAVSKKTDYLLAGEAPGAKFVKANQIGIKIISEAELNDMIALSNFDKSEVENG